MPVMRFISVLTLLLASATSSHALEIARNGRSTYTIVLPADAIPAEKSAARELQDYLRQITGAELPIRTEPTSVFGRQIFVGAGAAARQAIPNEKWDSLASDAIVIKTAGDNLILAGGRPRGSMYAVYTFLEDYVGVRWWTSKDSQVPHHSSLEVPEINLSYSPKLVYREAFNQDPSANPAFAARLKLNGHYNNIPEKLGGHYNILGWCHTSYDLLPPEKYFAAHPDWYSMRNGKRDPNRGQLCWSNTSMTMELAAQALQLIRKNPSAGFISISQNDWHGNCQCESCGAIDKREESAAGSLVFGVNAVAAEIAKEYPNFLVETLAYQYTRKPPKSICPADNVLIRLCSIECNFAHPLASDSNAAFRDDLLGWKEKAKNLFIWNYVTNFTNYLIPHPNWESLDDDLRLFSENHVVGVFEQGDIFNKLAGDFLPLRAWLLAHLMWDPSRDADKLTKEFLTGYYGPAAPYLEEYLAVVNEPSKDPNFRLRCYVERSSMTPETVHRATELFDKAADAVKHDAALSLRLRRERLPLEHVRLAQFELKEKPGAPDACSAYDKAASEYVTTAKSMGVVNYAEGQSFNAFVPMLLSKCMRQVSPHLPTAGERIPKGSFDLQEDQFQLFERGSLSDVVDDPKASNGKAARMGGNHRNWAVQMRVPEKARSKGAGPWRCWLVVRCDSTTSAGAAFSFGLHDPQGNKYVAKEDVSLGKAGDGEYHAYGIFVDKLKKGQYFWVAPEGNDKVKSVLVDRIYLEKMKDPDPGGSR